MLPSVCSCSSDKIATWRPCRATVGRCLTKNRVLKNTSSSKPLSWRSIPPFEYVLFSLHLKLWTLNCAVKDPGTGIQVSVFKLARFAVHRLTPTVAVPDPRPTLRVQYGRQDSLATVIRTWNRSHCPYRGDYCHLPRHCLWALYCFGKRAST